MAIDAGAIWGLADVLRKRIGSEEASKRTAATVVRTDKDGTVWVRCAGSDTDTPVNGTCPVVVGAGDVVEVEISDGRLSVLGNSTDPAAGIESAKGAVMPVVEEAVERARQAVAASTEDIATAKRAAGEAKEVASATSQHFWTDDDGVHITEVERDEWLDESSDSHHAGSNALFTTIGQLFRDGLNNLVSITRSAVAFFDGTGNDEGNISALFGYNSARVGKLNSVHTTMSNDGFSIANGEGTPAIEVSGVTEETEVRWQYSHTYTAPDPYPAANGFLIENVEILVTGFYRYDLQQGQWVYDTPEEVDENALVAQLVRDGNVVEPSPTGTIEVRGSEAGSGYVIYVTINRYYSDDGTQLMEAGGEYTLRVGVPKTNWSTTPYVRIGTDAQSHANIDYHSLQMVDKEGDTYFHVSDLRGADGTAELSVSLSVSTSLDPNVSSRLVSPVSIDEIVSVYSYSPFTGTEVIEPWLYELDESDPDRKSIFAHPEFYILGREDLYATVRTSDRKSKGYTLGKRVIGGIGPLSMVSGACDATGAYSSATGNGSLASGGSSHAQGFDSTAYGYASHAEGYRTMTMHTASHAEGCNTLAMNFAAHAEGDGSSATGYASHAQNRGTIARTASQTALGRYNVEDPVGTYALILGNGTSDEARSNALAVDWFGIPYHRNKAGDWGSVFDLIYPVGSIYMSVNATSPATLFGGTWERIQGRFLLAATDDGSSGASQAAGRTGGSATVTLTAAQSGLPAHTHAFTNPKIPNHVHSNTHHHTYEYTGDASAELSGSNPSGRGAVVRRKNPSEKTGLSTADYTGNTGNPTTLPATTGGAVGAVTDGAKAASSAHENMPPWLAVYVWKRTA